MPQRKYPHPATGFVCGGSGCVGCIFTLGNPRKPNKRPCEIAGDVQAGLMNQLPTVDDSQADDFGPSPLVIIDDAFLFPEHLSRRARAQKNTRVGPRAVEASPLRRLAPRPDCPRA